VDQDRVWQASLKGISENKIKSGLNLLAESGDEWPPSAPEFRKLCIGDDDTWEQKGQAYQKFEPSGLLEQKPARKEVAQSNIEKMRQTLTKGNE